VTEKYGNASAELTRYKQYADELEKDLSLTKMNLAKVNDAKCKLEEQADENKQYIRKLESKFFIGKQRTNA
jgi:hypothetical protein